MAGYNGIQPRINQNLSVQIASPLGTNVLVSGASISAIGSNDVRRGIIFINPNLSGPIIRVCPANQTAVIGQGVPVLPGGQISFIGDGELINYNCGWNTIADSGSNNPLQILELL
jgi:hypothetical protein